MNEILKIANDYINKYQIGEYVNDIKFVTNKDNLTSYVVWYIASTKEILYNIDEAQKYNEIIRNSNYNDYQKLLYGLPVSKEVMKNIKNFNFSNYENIFKHVL